MGKTHQPCNQSLEGTGRERKSVSVCMFNVCKQDISQLGRFIRIDHTDYEARYTVKVLN